MEAIATVTLPTFKKINFIKKVSDAIFEYFKNLPKGFKILLTINLLVYLICWAYDILFSFNVIKVLGIYATIDERFRIYQFISNMFTHNLFYDHILSNLIGFFIFGVNVERKIGTKNFILLYLISGITGSIFCDYALRQDYLHIMSEFKQLADAKMDCVSRSVSKMGLEYDLEDNLAFGASGSVFGICLAYLLFNILNWRKIIFNLLILFFIYSTITLIQAGGKYFATDMNHFGGMVGGFTFALTILLIRFVKWIQKRKEGVFT
ncbi:MAG: rhomboid family intramembrane serine protease [Bacteroidota bacterium]